MWNLWRAGYRIVSFIHDQAVVEVREDDLVEEKRQEVIDLMRRGMLEVVPGMKVQVEAVVTALSEQDRGRLIRVTSRSPVFANLRLGISRSSLSDGRPSSPGPACRCPTPRRLKR